MVSLELYFKAFYHSVPKRFELIKYLRKTKSSIDKKINSGKDPTKGEILELLEIIGRDYFFRKAEKGKKPTLRHLVWKNLKSLKKFQQISDRLGNSARLSTDTEIAANLNNLKNRNRIIYVKNLLDAQAPYVISFLEKLDSTYRDEAEALNKSFYGEDNIIPYRKLIKFEEIIYQEIQPMVSEIKKVVINFKNLLAEYTAFYEKFVKQGTKRTLQNALIWDIFLLEFMFANLLFYVSPFSIADVYGSGVIGSLIQLYESALGPYLGVIELVSFGYLLKLINDQKIVKFIREVVNERMI